MLLLALGFLTVALVVGNNLSACVGPAIGSRALSRRTGVIIGIAGFVLGLLAQGHSMVGTVSSIAPGSSETLRLTALFITVVLFSAANLVRAPLSLTMLLVGLLAGHSAGGHVGTSPFTWIAVAWGVSPVLAAATAFLLLKLVQRVGSGDVWAKAVALKAALIALSFAASFAFGANTIGLVVAVCGFSVPALLLGVAGTIVGSVYLSQGLVRRISQELFLMRYQSAVVALLVSTVMVQIATFFGLPLSSAGVLSFAVLGAGLSYKTKLMPTRPLLATVAGWVIAPVAGFLIGLVL